MWKQIKNDFIEEVEDGIVIYIDAWKTNNVNEQGKVIAKVKGFNDGKIEVEYINENAKTNEFAQEMIKEAKTIIINEFA